jgi:hypothetical protein
MVIVKAENPHDDFVAFGDLNRLERAHAVHHEQVKAYGRRGMK